MRRITKIYIVILIGMMVSGSIILFTTLPWDAEMPSSDDSFLIAVPLFTFIGVVLGRVIYKRKLDELVKLSSLKEKLKGYQSALIVKYILIVFPFLLGVVATLQSHNIFYLMISGTLVMYFMTMKPSRTRVKRHLKLSTKMGLQFNDKNEIID